MIRIVFQFLLSKLSINNCISYILIKLYQSIGHQHIPCSKLNQYVENNHQNRKCKRNYWNLSKFYNSSNISCIFLVVEQIAHNRYQDIRHYNNFNYLEMMEYHSLGIDILKVPSKISKLNGIYHMFSTLDLERNFKLDRKLYMYFDKEICQFRMICINLMMN